MPRPKTGTFHRQFGLGKAVGHFNLPATGIDEDDRPGIVGRGDGQVGEQVPRLATATGTGNDESEGNVRSVGMGDGDKNHPGSALTTPTDIINEAVAEGTFAPRHLPGRTFAFCVAQMVLGFPTHDEHETLVQQAT